MEIEMSPHLRHIGLDGGIEGCGERHHQDQGGRIRRIDVIEMDDAGILRAHLAHQVGYTDQHDDDEEDEQVSIAEPRTV